jgi:hypothetical protein
MKSLDGQPVIVVTKDGTPVAVGRFHASLSPLPEGEERVDLAFETEVMACRLRVPKAKISEIKATWDGAAFRYVLPAGDSVWIQPQ